MNDFGCFADGYRSLVEVDVSPEQSEELASAKSCKRHYHGSGLHIVGRVNNPLPLLLGQSAALGEFGFLRYLDIIRGVIVHNSAVNGKLKNLLCCTLEHLQRGRGELCVVEDYVLHIRYGEPDYHRFVQRLELA